MTALNVSQARFNMIEQQIRPWNVLDRSILDQLAEMRRDLYVGAAYQNLAYADLELPLPDGERMLAPRLEARLLQDLHLHGHETVLEVGCGSGFMAALLARRAKHVLSLEISQTLAKLAQANLQRDGVNNVEVRLADGSNGAANDAPFDAILLSGSVAQIPDSLLQQLRVGGRLAAISGDEPVMHAVIISRISESQFETRTPWDANAPRLRNFTEKSEFAF